MTFPDLRRAGLLLHPTSLPGPQGRGNFRPTAFHFVDWLAAAQVGAWQVLPLVPPGAGNSPYANVSAFAGSPLLVALEPLVGRGWLDEGRLAEADGFDADRVNFERVAPWRLARLHEAQVAFLECGDAGQFVQWCFARQWQRLKAHAQAHGVRLLGDLPIFVAHHPADCMPDAGRAGPRQRAPHEHARLARRWTWRFRWDPVGPEPAPRLAALGALYGRVPERSA